FYIKPKNYTPYFPFHFSGIFKGATTVFFAFLGFDVISASAAEVKKPEKNMPIGIIGTLIIAVLLYIGVSIVLTGMISYNKLDVANP
ncbi:amino acid permease, partial [Klebsiella pneumoniae]|nr:amino acid permease [Klebsiella pneumoniae]